LSEHATERDRQDAQAGVLMTFAVIVVSIFLFLGKIAGFLKEVLIAKYWGLSGAVDAFKVVYNSVVFLVYSKIEKLLRPTYLPIFVKHRDEGQEAEAWRFASVVGTLAFLSVAAVTALCIGFAPGLIRLGWSDMSLPDQALAARLLRVSGLAMLLLVMSVMTELTLHAYKRFTAPAFADAMTKLALFGAIGGLVGLGVYPASRPDSIITAAIGVLAGGALRLLLQIPALWRKLRLSVPSLQVRRPDVVRMFGLIPPVIIGLIFSSARTYFDSRFSTFAGEGVYTALDFARKVSDMVILIMPLAVSLVVYPYVSEWAARENRQRLADSLVSMTRVMAFVFVPMAVALMLLALPAVQFVYQDAEGAFTYQDALLVRRGVVPYAAGIPFLAVEASINKWYFALSDTATPNYVGASMAVLHILIAYVGVYYFRRSVGVMALALTVSKGLKVIMLYGLLRGRIGSVDARAVWVFVAKLIACTAVMALVVAAVGVQFSGMLVDAAGRMAPLMFLAICAAPGAVAYIIAAAILRVEELHQLAGYVLGKLRRGK
jgi:putative peptidoglycan lipid II flippase